MNIEPAADPNAPPTEPPEPPRRKPYKIRGPETWALIRESYLAGASARDLAARYDVTRWAIAARAAREGWTKRSRAEGRPPPALGPVCAGTEDAEGPEELVHAALRGVGVAMRDGRLEEAKSLAQLADLLSRVAVRAPRTNLETIARALLDPEFAGELMSIADDPDPDPVKVHYWEERRRQDAEIHAGFQARVAAFRESVRREVRGEVAAEGAEDLEFVIVD